MKIVTVEVTPGVSFAGAREIPSTRERPAAKSVGHKSSGNGVRRQRNAVIIPGKLAMELKTSDQRITEANRTRLVILNGKGRFIREADYQAGTW
jgi:hypothetical protein